MAMSPSDYYIDRSITKPQKEKTMNLHYDALRQANIKRLPLFKNKHGERAHSQPDGSDWSDSQWCEAVLGELGEYANKHKKFVRGDLTKEEFTIEAGKELADVAIYLDLLAFRLGIDLGQAIIEKWNETSNNLDIPLRLDEDDWHYTRNPMQCWIVNDGVNPGIECNANSIDEAIQKYCEKVNNFAYNKLTAKSLHICQDNGNGNCEWCGGRMEGQ
jgi:NTP pyrophosphatase (non-canonical NTP hydrolase)